MKKLEEIGNNTQLKPEIDILLRYLSNIERILQNRTKTGSNVNNNLENPNKPPSNTEMTVDEDIRRSVLKVFGQKPAENFGTNDNSPNTGIQFNVDEDLRRSVVKLFGAKPTMVSTTETGTDKPLCTLIDIRGDIPNGCEDIISMKNQKLKKMQKNRKRRPKLDVRSGAGDSHEDFTDDDTEENEYMISTTDATTIGTINEDVTERNNGKKTNGET